VREMNVTLHSEHKQGGGFGGDLDVCLLRDFTFYL
jgi:hypothetical protein